MHEEIYYQGDKVAEPLRSPVRLTPERARQADYDELARSSGLLPRRRELFSCNLMLRSEIDLG